MFKLTNHINIRQIHLFILIILFFFNYSITAQNENQSADNKIRTVVIDPGHGGKDPGATGKFSKEKDIVLDIGLKLGSYIEKNIPDVKVVYTRKTDEFIPLYRRAEIANENNADLFISIHANGWSDPKSFGTETLILGLHRADENFEVAKRENSVILMEENYTTRYENFNPNSLESYIIFSLMQNVYDNQSISFAGLVQNQFRERVMRHDRGVRRQGLLVLAQISMPGVLVETGFITNIEEEKYLNSEEGQDYLASAIYRAFKDYKTDIESRSVNYARNTVSASETIQPADTNNIYFKVQVVVSSEAIDIQSETFKNFKDVEEFRQGVFYKYAVGKKSKYDEIVEYCRTVKEAFPDAFVIAVRGSSIIPVAAALDAIYSSQSKN